MTMMEPLSSFALFCIFVHICLPTGTPATVRSCVFPKLDCTKTPIVYSLPPNVKILDAEPIPPFNPKQTVPLPAPTAPCLKFFSACSIAKSTSSASITRSVIWLILESFVSPTTGLTLTNSLPFFLHSFSVNVTSPSAAFPTFSVFVSAIGVSNTPSSSIWTVPCVFPKPFNA